MRALTVLPGVPNSLRLDEVPAPPLSEGAILARAIALGICATDREIVAGDYGAAPKGQERLILGHESLGRVEEAPAGSGFAPGDLIVGFVRHPDPVPCPACAAGEWDMCRNGLYTEHGIKARNGFGAELFPHRAGIRHQARSRAGCAGRVVGADQRGCQGLGPYRWYRAAFAVVDAADRTCHRCRTGRTTCRAHWYSARSRRPCARPQCHRTEARARPGRRRDLSQHRDHQVSI